MATNTILIRITGPDRPGITAALMAILARADTAIEDIEQIVIRGRLILTLIVKVDVNTDLRADLLLFAYEQKIEIDFDLVEATPSAQSPRLVVTLLGARIAPSELEAIAGVLAANGANIDRIIRLAREPVMAYELVVGSDDRDSVASALLEQAHSLTCDIAVQRQGLRRRTKRMVFLDVDSTLIQDEVIELLAAEAGRHDEVAAITARAMAGELDFKESLTTRVAALAGLPESVLDQVKSKVRLTPGAEVFVRTLHHLGYKTAIVSGGFTAVTEHLAEQLGIDFHHANQLEVVDGVLTGRTTGPVVDRQEKATYLRTTAAAAGIPLDQVVAVGDGANDLDMLSTAGLGIAFNARPVVRQAADASVNVPYLDAILFVLGFNRSEIEEAEATWRPTVS